MISKQKAILCVDDEEIVLRSLKFQLREHYGAKYHYEVATSAEEALEIIDDLISDSISTILIITDWLMPGMKGDEFLSIVNKKHPKIVKVMLTGHANIDAIKNAEDNGNLFTCVKKPWDKKDFLTLIEDALEEGSD